VQHIAAVESNDPRNNGDLARLECGEEADVDQWDRVVATHAFVEAVAGRRQAVGGEVADVDLAHRCGDRIEDTWRQVPEQHAKRERGDAVPLAQHDVRRSSYGDGDIASPALDQINRDLGAGVAASDHEDTATGKRRRVAIGRCVQQLAGEPVCAGPVWRPRGVVVAGRDDHRSCRQVAGRRTHLPAPVGAIDGADRSAQPDIETVVAGVVLEIADDVVASDPLAVATWDPVARQMRQPAHGVEVEPVVVTVPARSDRVSAVDHNGVDALPPEHGCRREAGRTGADHHHVGCRANGHRASSWTGSPHCSRPDGRYLARVEIWFNPGCSKCRAAKAALDEAGLTYTLRRYLDEPPTTDELRTTLDGLDLQPWDITRTAEPLAAELGIADLPHDREAWIALLAAHPSLIQRPIMVTTDGQAWVARDPETVDTAVKHAAAEQASD